MEQEKTINLSEMDLKSRIDLERLPSHVAIIMDGNGRWAKQRGKPRTFGHQNGVTSVRETAEAAAELAWLKAKQADFLMTFYNLGNETVTDIIKELGYALPDDYIPRNFDYYIIGSRY